MAQTINVMNLKTGKIKEMPWDEAVLDGLVEAAEMYRDAQEKLDTLSRAVASLLFKLHYESDRCPLCQGIRGYEPGHVTAHAPTCQMREVIAAYKEAQA